MNQPANLRETLLKYRLHELDDTERERIDDLMIADAEFADAFQEAEYDLLDAYAAGELSVEDRLRVERALQPKGRLTVAPPETKARVLHFPEAANVTAVRREWTGWVGLAALLLIGLFLGGIVWQMTKASKVAAPELGQVTEQMGGRSELAQVNPPAAAASNRTPTPTGVVTQARSRSESGVIATVLLGGAQRSDKLLTLHVAPKMTAVRFTWPTPAEGVAGTKYELQVVSETGEVRCHSVSVAGAAKGGERLVNFTCPSGDLTAGMDFVRVFDRSASADAEPLIEVTLAVER